jgi:hypothetical protein
LSNFYNEKYFITDEQRAQALEIWQAGATTAELAEQMGWAPRAVDHLRQWGKLHLPSRPIGSGKKTKRRDLTPREIRSRAAGVRDNWSEFELLNRRAGPGRVLADKDLERWQPNIHEPKRYKLGFIEGSING